MRCITVPIFVTLLLTLSCPAPRVHAVHLDADGPDWTPIECPVEIPVGRHVECGMVTVPEDHTQSDGSMIPLAVAIVHSFGDDPAPDPLLFINGGPGARTLDSMLLWVETLNPLLAARFMLTCLVLARPRLRA